MIISLLLSVAIPLMLGFTVVSFLCPDSPDSRVFPYNFIAQVSLAAGLGFGILSIMLFIWLLIFGSVKGFPVFEGVFFLLLMLLSLYAIGTRKLSCPYTVVEPFAKIDSGRGIYIFCGALIIALLLFSVVSLRAPHGEWDAWAIWNLRARFIFRGGDQWRNAFAGLLDWSHPDYPLLVPLAVTFGWGIVGHETVAVPMTLGLTFLLAIIFLGFSSLSLLRGQTQGMLAGLTLLGTSFLIKHGAAQYADVPLGFFFLSTVVLLAFYDGLSSKSRKFLFLAGMTAAFSAWTKNEGILFLFSIIIARFLVKIRADGWKTAIGEISSLLLGVIPVVIVLIYFKAQIAPPNDLISSQTVATFHNLLDYSRYLQILKAYLIIGVKFTGGIVGVPLLIIYLSLMGVKRGARNRVTALTALITVSLMLTVYFIIHLLTPYDLAWHLEHSVDRLFLQLWPLGVFCFFLIARTPGEASTGQRDCGGSEGLADLPGKCHNLLR